MGCQTCDGRLRGWVLLDDEVTCHRLDLVLFEGSHSLGVLDGDCEMAGDTCFLDLDGPLLGDEALQLEAHVGYDLLVGWCGELKQGLRFHDRVTFGPAMLGCASVTASWGILLVVASGRSPCRRRPLG